MSSIYSSLAAYELAVEQAEEQAHIEEDRMYKRQLRVCTVLFVLVVVAASWYTYHMCSNGGHMYEGLKIVALHT